LELEWNWLADPEKSEHHIHYGRQAGYVLHRTGCS
jgi:hypothetical protein